MYRIRRDYLWGRERKECSKQRERHMQTHEVILANTWYWTRACVSLSRGGKVGTKTERRREHPRSPLWSALRTVLSAKRKGVDTWPNWRQYGKWVGTLARRRAVWSHFTGYYLSPGERGCKGNGSPRNPQPPTLSLHRHFFHSSLRNQKLLVFRKLDPAIPYLRI